MRFRLILHPSFLSIGLIVPGAVVAHAQTDVAASIYGAFTGATSGNGVEQSPSNAAGALIELRHIANPLVGFEATYAYNRANQTYSSDVPAPDVCAIGVTCPNAPPPVHVPAGAHVISADWIASIKVAKLRPFALADIGLMLDVPASGQADTSTTTTPLFIYGAGLDWGLLPHLGLRQQYRGNLYKAPDLTRLYTSTNAFTHTAEPMIGIYLRL